MKSPFKFLDSYTREDKDIFFGRDKEIEDLYEMAFQTNLILLYGASGTGKTSLINCGLSNKFQDTDWFALFVRRKENLLASLHQEIREQASTPISDDASLGKALKSLFYDQYKPLYLIFDQFEEIFILGDKEEQREFFENLAKLLQVRLQCTIIISMREEYIAYLSDFEKIIPSLFDHRYRIEKMKRADLEQVIEGTAKAFEIDVYEPEITVPQIIDNLNDGRHGVDLTNLQVYLDRLYREDLSRMNGTQRSIRFDPALIETVGELEDVLGDFLEEQLVIVEKGLVTEFNANAEEYNAEGVPLDVLFMLVTDDKTRRSVNVDMIKANLQKQKNIPPELIDFCIDRFEEMRIFKKLEA